MKATQERCYRNLCPDKLVRLLPASVRNRHIIAETSAPSIGNCFHGLPHRSSDSRPAFQLSPDSNTVEQMMAYTQPHIYFTWSLQFISGIFYLLMPVFLPFNVLLPYLPCSPPLNRSRRLCQPCFLFLRHIRRQLLKHALVVRVQKLAVTPFHQRTTSIVSDQSSQIFKFHELTKFILHIFHTEHRILRPDVNFPLNKDPAHQR